MYGSLLLDLLYDTDNGQLFLSKLLKAKSLRTVNQFSECLNYQSLVIFSGNSQHFGRILYANNNFASFLNFNIDLIQTYSFSNFLPNLISKGHDKMLLDFIEHCTDTIVYKFLPLFLLNNQGFLCECFITIESIANDDSVNFFSAIDPINSSKRELAIVSLDGYIYNHSQNFLTILGNDQNHGENINIRYYLPEININELIIDTIYEVNLSNYNSQQKNKTIGIILKCCLIKDIKIYVLYLTDNLNQIKKWRKKTDFYRNDHNNFKIQIIKGEILVEDGKEIMRKNDKKIMMLEEAKQKIEKIDEKVNKTDNNKSQHWGVQNSENHLDSLAILEKNEAAAFKKSILALKVSKILLLITVINK